MTCLAFDGKVLAADRGVMRSHAVTEYRKIHVVDGHRGKFIMGFCGFTALTDAALTYFNSPIKVDFPDCKKYETDLTDTIGLAIDKDGVCRFIYGDGAFSEPLRDPWAADGSGCVFLTGALAAGASAEQAIQLAIQHTTCAYLGVDTLSVEEVFNA
ncbi:ATP-dependent protease [Hafnia phage yong3]|nr:ATP-dependent protease [Hafnia phage yong3]